MSATTQNRIQRSHEAGQLRMAWAPRLARDMGESCHLIIRVGAVAPVPAQHREPVVQATGSPAGVETRLVA